MRDKKFISKPERQKRMRFAIGMAAIDGGKPTAFTRDLLQQYESGQLTSRQVKQRILQEYTRVTN